MDKTIDEIKKMLEGLKKYRDGRIIGFPGSEPLPIAMEAFTYTMGFNPNAILLHFRGKKFEGSKSGKELDAFAPIHQMEVELLMWITSLLYGEKGKSLDQVVEEGKDRPVWGYITSGGTESNIFALWVARNYFMDKFNDKKIQIVVPQYDVTHYSIFKALNLLGLSQTADDVEYSENLIYVPIDKDGYPDYKTIDSKLKDLPTIFIVNAPSINTGLIDNIIKGFRFLNKISKRSKNKLWIHIDGAFGMFFIPFLEEKDYKNIGEPILSFYNKEKSKLRKLYFPHARSISVDLHKMGLIPYPAGVILINEENGWELIRRRVGYIAGHYDETLSGSRSGAAVVSAYAAIKELGFDGYKNIMCNCLRLTNKFLELFKMFRDVFEIVGRPITNVFAIRFTQEFINKLKDNKKLKEIVEFLWIKRCVEDYTIVDTHLKYEVENIENKIFRFVIMPHVTDEVFENFVNNVSNFMQEVRNVR